MSDESLQADKPARDRKTREKRQVNYVKWGLGCSGFGMVFCTGIIVLGVIVWPVVFRSLPGEWQDRFIRRFNCMADLVHTHVPVALPTSAFKSGDAMALLATSTSTLVASPTATQAGASDLSSGTGNSGTGGTVSTPTPTFTPVPPTPTLAAPIGSPTPVVNQTPTPILPTPAPPSTQAPVPVSFHNPGFKWVPQHWNDCGPANITQALAYYGWQGDQEGAAAWLKPNP